MLEKVCLPVFVKFSTVALDYDLLIKEIMNTTVLVVDLSKIENSVLVLIFPFVSFVVLGHNVRKKVKCFRQFDITNACSIFLVRFGLEVKKKKELFCTGVLGGPSLRWKIAPLYMSLV